MVRRTVLLVMLLLPSPVLGAELDLEFGGGFEYDSNVYRQQNNEKDDVIFRMVPGATLSNHGGDWLYRLRYLIPFEQGIETGEDISDFDQVVQANSSWTWDEATQLFAGNNFHWTRTVRAPFNDTSDVPGINTRRDRILVNTADAGIRHAFAPRLTGSLTVSHNYFKPDQQFRQKNQTFATTADLNYAVNGKHQMGGGFTFTVQDFDGSGGIPGSQTYYYNAFGSWVFRFDETTTLTVSGGPTLIQTDENRFPATTEAPQVPSVKAGGGSLAAINPASCTGEVNGLIVLQGCGVPDVEVFDPTDIAYIESTNITAAFLPGQQPSSSSDLRLTGFGRAELSKRFTRNLSSTLAYRRQQSNASGLGGSTILDAVTALGAWDINQWWDFELRFDYTHRESVTKTTQTFAEVAPFVLPSGTQVAALTGLLTSARVKNAIDTDRWGVGGRLNRKIGRNADATLRLSYNKQQSKNRSRGKASDFDDFLAIFGVRYRFDPITVW